MQLARFLVEAVVLGKQSPNRLVREAGQRRERAPESRRPSPQRIACNEHR
jgi:hypothetical protein